MTLTLADIQSAKDDEELFQRLSSALTEHFPPEAQEDRDKPYATLLAAPRGLRAAGASLLCKHAGSFRKMPLSLGLRFPPGRGGLLLRPGSFEKMPELVELRPPTLRTIRHLKKAAPPAFLTDESPAALTRS
jgi:hypothetical protein